VNGNFPYFFVPRYYGCWARANSNTLTDVIPQILAQGLLALRSQTVLPALVNTDYGDEARERGSTVDVPIPAAIAATAVVPSYVAPDDTGIEPDKVQIVLDQWYEAPFFLSDKDVLESMNGTVPMQVSAAVKALAENVNAAIFAQYKGVYGYAGVAATTPFATSTYEATQARKVLNQQLAPMGDRRFVIDPDAEANALNLRAFQDMNFGVTADDIREGRAARKLGFLWAMDQQVPTHTAGTITTGLATKTSTAQAVGDKTIVCTTAASTGACALLEGDVVTFAGQSQTYVLTAAATQATAATDVTLNIEPGLKVALAGSEAVSVKSSHVVNLAFQRDAFAFASRPLEDAVPGQLGVIIQSAVDPVSGLTLRLEVSRQHKRIRWSFDILYGTKLVRRELACRVAG